MRLTADVLGRCRVFLNPVCHRELDLVGLKIPAIENLGACRDQVDTINFTDNEIREVANLPLLRRLKHVLFSNNRVTHFDGENLAKNVPNLKTIMLANNRVSLLNEVDELSGLKNLETLVLANNPVTLRPHYRLYVIHRLPQVKYLDFEKVKQAERERALSLFGSDYGKRALELAKPKSKSNLTEAQKAALVAAITNAKTQGEVDRLERMLKAGIMPTDAITEKEQATNNEEATKEKEETENEEATKEKEATDNAKETKEKEEKNPPQSPKTKTPEKATARRSSPRRAKRKVAGEQTEKKESPKKRKKIVAETPSPKTKTKKSSSSKAASADVAWVDALKVTELRAELGKRGSPKKGRKADLAKRLKSLLKKK